MNDDSELEIEVDDAAMRAWLETEEGQHVDKMLSNLLNGFLIFWMKYRQGEDDRSNEHHEQVCEIYSEVTALMNVVFTSLYEAISVMEKPRPVRAKKTLLSKVLN